MSDALMNAADVVRMLGISRATWQRHLREYARLFEVARPIGQRRYSRARVEQYVSAETMARFGKTQRTA
ncbi:MAG TPA: helix-turn-helix domain-containing protein [Rhizomicrobium sp.]|jgi:predicted site-specific integrase-resolvase|nr:helix-turn-helix domain-containing protein [Rhizomicrobium sp.]